jgi:hypothetical protein
VLLVALMQPWCAGEACLVCCWRAGRAGLVQVALMHASCAVVALMHAWGAGVLLGALVHA